MDIHNNLLNNIITSFERNINEPFIGQYGFQDETTSMKQMAMLYYAVNPGKYKITSTKTADGKSKYSYIQPSYVERIKRDWKNGNTGFLVNSALAKIPILSTPLSQWYDNSSSPYKWYLPPAERIRRLKFRFRYHNGRLVNFGSSNYSFTLKFVLQTPQILRSSNSIVYPAGKIFS